MFFYKNADSIGLFPPQHIFT